MNPNEARQNAYLQLVQALLQCPPHLEQQLLELNSEFVDLGLVMTLLTVAQRMIEQDDRQAVSTIQWLVDFAQQLAQKLGLDMGESPAEDDEEYAKFVLDLWQTVNDSDGDEAIVYAFLEEHLTYLNEHLLAILPQQIDRLFALKPEPEWKFIASYIHNLAVDLGEFTSGNRLINIELAIICYDRALSVYTQRDFPEEWAMMQNNLANTYRDRIKGDRTANLELAIGGYKAALEVLTPRKYPIIQATLEATIELRDTIAQRNLHHPEIDAIKTPTSSPNPEYPNFFLYLLQTVVDSQGNGRLVHNFFDTHLSYLDEKLLTNLPQQVRILLAHKNESDWKSFVAEALNTLAVDLWKFPRGDRAINLEVAIECYQLALEVRTRAAYPEDWARTQMNLAVAYSERIRGERAANLEQSIECSRLALEVFARADYPEKWAMTQNNLANAYGSRIRGAQAANLELAIDCYKLALEIYTREDYPEDWAKTQMNLANAYQSRIWGKRATNLELAIDCYKLALEIYTREDYPEQRATTQMNLAGAYGSQSRGEQAADLELAIECSRLALEVFTPSAYPEQWATTQMNLAGAYGSRSRGEQATNLEKSIECSRLALDVFTSEAYPEQWAGTQMNLANAYGSRIWGERAANLEKSIECSRLALDVFTSEAYPEHCLEAARNLGNLHYEINNWQPAIRAYEKAMLAVETSRSWVLNDESRQELLKGAFSIYQNAIQCAINLPNYPQAIQFTERIRSRNLVELMESTDFRANAQLSPEIDTYLAEYKDIKHQIQSQRQQIQSQYQPSNSLGDNTTHPASRDPNYLANLVATISTLEGKKAETYSQLRQLDPVLAGQIQVGTIDFAAIQQLITNPDTAILTCYTTKDDTYIFIIKQSGAPTIHTCKNKGFKEFQQWLQIQWIDFYAKDVENWKKNISPRLKDIAKRLELDTLIAKHLTNINELIIVPHLNLHQIPFAALPINLSLEAVPKTSDQNPLLGGVPEEQGKFLSDRFLIRSIPSCQILQYCDKRSSIITAIIGTVEDAEDNLLGARYEGEQIAALYSIPTTNRLRGSTRATPDNYRDLLTRVNRLHSSHHGTFRRDNPLESALILAQGEQITLRDLLVGKRYPDLDEVFLSACETHVGTTTITDDIATLTTGFLSIGARSVQSTLWVVNDIVTVIFSLFYHQQRHQGKNPTISLRTAQQQLRNLTGSEFAQYHPRIIEYFNTHSPAIISSLTDEIDKLIKQQSTLDLNTQKGAWDELQANIKELELKRKKIVGIPWDSKNYRGKNRPFEHPFYWAGFITQGMA